METSFGTIDSKRLSKIPKKFHGQHEFCFFLHDSMLSIFKEFANANYSTLQLNFKDEGEADRFIDLNDPISYFYDINRRDLVQKLSVVQAMMAIFGDFFNFLYEALIALEKRKFVVALALLRKPLKENLLLLTIILADEEAFFKSLETSPAANFGHPGIQDSDRIRYFSDVKKLMPFSNFFDPIYLHNLIFDVSLLNGFAPLFDKATHLVTNRKQIRTESLNLNFIFKNPHEDDIYEWVYNSLSYVLMYSIFLQIELLRKQGVDSSKLTSWYSLIGLGSYSGLFIKGQNPVANSINKLLKPFLVCPHCNESVKISKSFSAKFFITQNITCKHCNLDHNFPLFWLMSKTNWSLNRDGTAVED